MAKLMDGAIGGAATILGGCHHRLELLKVDAAATVGIDRLDHVVKFVDGALEAEAVEHELELCGGDEAIFVTVVEIEGVAKLVGFAIDGGVRATKGGKLREADEAVAIGVEVFHDTMEVLRRDTGFERPEHVVELVGGDLVVAVGVKVVEDCLEFVHVLEKRKELAFENLKFTLFKIKYEILFFQLSKFLLKF
ncbi:hypothetical protein HKD37_17G046924 [Glycine soja]